MLSVDTARAASRAAAAALADLPQVRVLTDSVRRAPSERARRRRCDGRGGADVAVLDPPRSGAGRGGRPARRRRGAQVIHIGCEAAAFARDIGLYRAAGYTVEQIRVFDSFPLTHHVECVALLTR